MFRKGLIACAIATMLTAGIGAARVGVYVATPPPAPRIERMSRRPGPGFVWTPGFYSWNGRRYVWVGGRWMRPPRGRTRFVTGAWVRSGRGWHYRPGFWR